jgi:hypothetical protein
MAHLTLWNGTKPGVAYSHTMVVIALMVNPPTNCAMSRPVKVYDTWTDRSAPVDVQGVIALGNVHCAPPLAKVTSLLWQ